MKSIIMITILVIVNSYIIKSIHVISWFDWLLSGVLTTIITFIIVVSYIILFDKKSMELIKKFLKIN